MPWLLRRPRTNFKAQPFPASPRLSPQPRPSHNWYPRSQNTRVRILQGDSEYDGTAIETSITGDFKITLLKAAT
jgi:hypothetical protein